MKIKEQGQEQQSNHLCDENRTPNLPVLTAPKPNLVPPSGEEQYRAQIEAYVLSSSRPPTEGHNYFAMQPDLSEHMRGILLCWLQEVVQKYRLMPETFFLTVRLVDAFLRVQPITRNRLQLVGVSALWIAAKYQETYQVPKLTNLEHLCDKAYKATDILTMEGRILEKVGFQLLAQPSPMAYFELLKHHAELSERDYWLARYLLEASAFDLNLQRFSGALLAYSVVFFLKKMRGYDSFGEAFLRPLLSPSEGEIRAIGRELCSLWHRAEQQESLLPLRTKFASKQFCEVSKMRLAERSR